MSTVLVIIFIVGLGVLLVLGAAQRARERARQRELFYNMMRKVDAAIKDLEDKCN